MADYNNTIAAGASMQKKQEITVEEAKDWIRQHRESIIENNERNKYYSKLGLSPNGKDSEPEKMDIEKSFSKGDLSLNFLVSRSSSEIRKGYIDKLLANGVLKLEPSKKYQSIIIFDWDDTLLCTSYLSGMQFLELSPEAKNLVRNLDDYAVRRRLAQLKLLNKSHEYGKLFIITNAAKGWVEYSSKLYLPKTFQFLLNEKVVIISARTNFEEEFPGDFHRWKVEAFKSVKKHFDTDLITNLMCVGDSNIEMEAAQILAREFSQTLVKTIKFRENPKPDELVKQQELVWDKLEQIYLSTKNLTIRLERKQSSPNSSTSANSVNSTA